MRIIEREEDEISENNRESEACERDEAEVPASTVSTTPGSSSRLRKRMRRSVNWKKNVRKKQRNAGLSYTSDTTNRVVCYYCCTCMHQLGLAHFNHFCSIGDSKMSIKDVLWLFQDDVLIDYLNHAVKGCSMVC